LDFEKGFEGMLGNGVKIVAVSMRDFAAGKFEEGEGLHGFSPRAVFC
jgi:hypothetical protein